MGKTEFDVGLEEAAAMDKNYPFFGQVIRGYGRLEYGKDLLKERIMQTRSNVAILSALLTGYMLCSPVAAADKTLEFKLVVKLFEPRALEAPNVPGQMVTQAKAFGVGIFKDGRIAVKDFIVVSDLNKGVGSMFGYSTYSFDDGSTITTHFTAEFKENQPVHGEYKILSGTGAYAGATGMGTLDSISSQFKGANMYNIRLNVKTP
jgi:hypothetical protein